MNSDMPTLTPPALAPQHTENGYQPEDGTVNVGLGQALLQHQSYQPAPDVVKFFLTFEPIPEQAWMKAGLPLAVAAVKRRIIANLNYVLYGVTDVMGDMMISLAAWAGRDRLGWEAAREVATAQKHRSDNEQFQKQLQQGNR